MDLRTARPPMGAAVRDKQFNRYGLVVGRVGREFRIRYLNGAVRTVFASNLEVVRKVRTVY